jgi:hypothetical protein
MTTAEAALKLGMGRGSVVMYARQLGIKKWVRTIRGRPLGRCYNLTHADLEAIAAECRRRQYRHSEIKSRNMQWVTRQFKAEKITARDPDERRRSLAKAVKAAAERRRQYREWLLRHDTV